VTGSARVHQQMFVGRRTDSTPHGGETADELRYRKLELANQNAAWRWHGKADTIRAGRQR
jgi:hypothetical protein